MSLRFVTLQPSRGTPHGNCLRSIGLSPRGRRHQARPTSNRLFETLLTNFGTTQRARLACTHPAQSVAELVDGGSLPGIKHWIPPSSHI